MSATLTSRIPRMLCIIGAVGLASLWFQNANAQGEPQDELLLGCWESKSPYERDQIPADKHEWGTTTWCFEKDGAINIRTFACGRTGGCDGWEEERGYRWRGSAIEILDLEPYARPDPTWIWRACQLMFVTRDLMSFQNCKFSGREWARIRKVE
jgi:hypothetical protein